MTTRTVSLGAIFLSVATLFSPATGCGTPDFCGLSAADVAGSYRLRLIQHGVCTCDTGDCQADCPWVFTEPDHSNVACDGTQCRYDEDEGGLELTIAEDGDVSGQLDKKSKRIACRLIRDDLCDLVVTCYELLNPDQAFTVYLGRQ